MDKNSVINLNPIFVNAIHTKHKLFNSWFLKIFLILEIIFIILCFYFFFRIEILYLYNHFINNNNFSEEDKKIYNKYIHQIDKMIKIEKKCIFKNKYFYPVYIDENNTEIVMLALNKKEIYFDTQIQCLTFLNISI